ncbi:MAG TPA: DUF2785 domain-containing protein [Anaerolineales bacterium]|jgi:hypothetical protein
MDKKFWIDIKENNFALPPGASAPALTEELFTYLGSTDPELRDNIAYEIFANWLDQQVYAPDQLRSLILVLILNLHEGLGERETDSVFLRSFSALCLAEIIHHDGTHPFLDKEELLDILARSLEYLEGEQDPRGYVAVKGWAHALAHTADLLYVLADDPRLGRDEMARILDGVRSKLVRPTDWTYVHGEDERLVRAVTAVFARNLLDQDTLAAWLNSFASPAAGSWQSSFEDDSLQNAYFNSRLFLKSLYLKVSAPDSPEGSTSLLPSISTAIQAFRQF